MNGWNQKWMHDTNRNNQITAPLIRQSNEEKFSNLFPDVIYQTDYDMIFQVPNNINSNLILLKNGEEVVDALKITARKVNDCNLYKIKFNFTPKAEDVYQFCFVLFESNSIICRLTSKTFQVKQFLKRSREESKTEQVLEIYKKMSTQSRNRLVSVLRQKYHKEDLKKFSRSM